MHETINKLRRIMHSIAQEHGRTPTAQEMADELEIALERVDLALGATGRTLSLDAPVGEMMSRTLEDIIPDEHAASPLDEVIAGNLFERSQDVLKMLTVREEMILRCRFGLGGEQECTLEELGQELGITRERVRQIEARALEKLRRPACLQHLGALPPSTRG
jgi:RNA polymerase primary sigma factor